MAAGRGRAQCVAGRRVCAGPGRACRRPAPVLLRGPARDGQAWPCGAARAGLRRPLWARAGRRRPWGGGGPEDEGRRGPWGRGGRGEEARVRWRCRRAVAGRRGPCEGRAFAAGGGREAFVGSEFSVVTAGRRERELLQWSPCAHWDRQLG